MNNLTKCSMVVLATVFFVSATGYTEAMILPESINGFEKSGGELSKFNLELENMEIVSGYFTLPNPQNLDEEWIFEFRNLESEYTIDGFHFLSQYNKELAFFVTADHREDGIYDVSIYIKEVGKDLMKLEYWAKGEMVSYEKPIELSMIVTAPDIMEMHRSMSFNMDVTNSEDDAKTNIIIEVYDSSGNFVKMVTGETNVNGYFPGEIDVKNNEFIAFGCYNAVITAEYKGTVITDEHEFKILPEPHTGKSYEHYVYQDDRDCLK